MNRSTGWAWAQDLTFSTKVDRTTADVGHPINLTITLSGDVSGIELPALEFPEGFVVAARSQSTNFSIHAGAMERSVSLLYVLIPQHAGTFQLGPFTIEHRKKTLQTEPIEVIVNRSVVPPSRAPQGERFTL